MTEAVGKVALGDRAAFADLCDALAPVMYATARQMLGPGPAADAALQAALTALWHEAADFRPEGRSAFGWAIGLVRREAAARRSAASDLPPLPAGLPFGLAVSQVEAIEPALFSALRRAWFFGEGYEDLAFRLGLKPSGIRAWMRGNLSLLAGVMTR